VSRSSYLGPAEIFRLDLACKPIVDAFGRPPYLVGSVNDRADFRDVDVRLILPDKLYRKLYRGKRGNRVRILTGLALTAYLREATGLPVDFQIQQQTAANKHHPGTGRNPLGLRQIDNFRGDAPAEEFR
jgi:hypothetical protein